MQNGHLDFYSLGIAPRILETLDKMNIKVPTPIQNKAIPSGLKGEDIIGIAQTGTGKTLAFGIPIVQNLAQNDDLALILVPTRELAIQVNDSLARICQPFKLMTSVLIGGASMYNQVQSLRRNVRIVIATPGRLIDHLQQKTISLTHVKILVLDEADRMLDMGFAPQIDRIIKGLPKERQTMLFSATMPPPIMKMASAHMKLPVHLEIAPAGTAAEKVSQELFILKKEAKIQLLGKILEQYHGSILLFTRTKHGAEKITRSIKALGQKAAEIHSDRTLGQRRLALEGFKSGKYRILVATDIAARGIDVHGIELVINFDLPDDADNYVHRIGRTGRAGHEGHAISFATPDQRNDVKKIESLIRKVLPVSSHPEVPSETFEKPQVVYRSHKSSNRGGGGFRRRRF